MAHQGRGYVWTIGKAACEKIEKASTPSSSARIARTSSYSVLRIDGVLNKVFVPSGAETARGTGTAAEKTNEVSSMR